MAAEPFVFTTAVSATGDSGWMLISGYDVGGKLESLVVLVVLV